MSLLNTSERLVRYLREQENLGIFNSPHGPILIVIAHEVAPLIFAVENSIRAIEEGFADDLKVRAGKPVPIKDIPPPVPPPVATVAPMRAKATYKVSPVSAKVSIPISAKMAITGIAK